MKTPILVRASLVAGLTLVAAVLRAADEPDEALPGTVLVIRPAQLVKVVARTPSSAPFDLPDPSNDPTVEGGTLEVYDTGGTGGANMYPLAAQTAPLGWKPLGTPPGAKGYKYKGAGSIVDPCKVVLVKPTVVKAVCKGAGVTLTPPFGGDVGIVLSIGTDTKRYGALFGGSIVASDSTLLKRKSAPPTFPPPPPTTSTSTSTTSTTVPGTCCNGESFVGITIQNTPGDCGDIPSVGDLACGALYSGGGLASQDLPMLLPDTGESILALTDCSAQLATLGATTSAQTGSSRRCTAVGCAFGAPLPVPVTSASIYSSCVMPTVSDVASGQIDCSTGAIDLSLPVRADVHTTGDLLPAVSGIQPCPLCVSGTCQGGPNDGLSCTPGSTDFGDAYPTSQDCPPPPATFVGSTSYGFFLSTATYTWSGVPSGGQGTVFCGYCRDADGTGEFQNPSQQCLENGMLVGLGCAQPFESCQQRTSGAFGPAGTAVANLTVTGSPANSLNDSAPHAAAFGSIWCSPPTHFTLMDIVFDLPGPSASGLAATVELKTTP